MPRTNAARSSLATRPRSTLRAVDLEQRGMRQVSPLELGLIELPTRPRSLYTMAMRKEAIDACEMGLLREAADLTLAAMTESGYARGILSDLTHGLWGLPRSFVGRADMIADLDDTPERMGQWRTLFPEPEAIRVMSWGITLGMGVGQMRRKYGARASYDYPISPEEAANWKALKGTIGQRVDRPIGAHDTRVLRAWSPKWARCQWWEDSAWYLMTADGEIRISHLDDPPTVENGETIPNASRNEWLRYEPYGSIKPWEFGAWKSLTLAFVAERDATFDRLRHAEVLAPVRVGKVPQGTTEKQRLRYLRQIREMQRLASFVLPPGLEYTIVESTGKVADIYKAIIEWARGEYAMVTGSIITAEGPAGFSKGDVQERFTRSILQSFAGSLSSCLWAGGLVPWAEENYGSPDAPRAEWDCTPPEDKLNRAKTISEAGDALTKMQAGLREVGRQLTAATVERYAQTMGLESEPIPASSVHVAKLDLGVDALNAVIMGAEGRAAQGLPPFGDERDEKTITTLINEGKARTGTGWGASDPGQVGMVAEVAEGPEPGPGDVPPTDEAAEALAAKMTAHGIPRCEHNALNRCRLCGIERVRDFDVDKHGQHAWRVAWRPIVRVVAPHANGALARPLLSMGGDA